MAVIGKEQLLEDEKQRKIARQAKIEERKKNASLSKDKLGDEGATGFAPSRIQIKSLKAEREDLVAQIDALQKSTERLFLLEPSSIEITEYANRGIRFLETDKFLELKNDIQKNGQSSAIIVRPKAGYEGMYELIYGRRRLEACKQLEIPVKTQIVEADDKKLAILQEIENLHREDISPFDRGRYYQLLINKGHFNSQVEISDEFGVSKAEVSKLFKIHHLPEWIKVHICNEGFTPKTRRLIEELSQAWFISPDKQTNIEMTQANLKDSVDALSKIEHTSDRIKKAIEILKSLSKPVEQKKKQGYKKVFKFKGGKGISFETSSNGYTKMVISNKITLTVSQKSALEESVIEWAKANLNLEDA